MVADLRGLWTIDLADARVAAVDAPEGTFVGGIDGLYAIGGELLGIQNGLRPHRVVRIALDDAAQRVERVAVVASNLPELAEMTTAAVGARGNHGAGRKPAGAARQLGLCSRLIRLRRNTLLKRSWQAADDCSSSVELTFISVRSSAP